MQIINSIFKHLLRATIVCATICLQLASAQEKEVLSGDLFSMSLEDVLDTQVTIASKSMPQSIREAAGAITVFDAQFIKASGVRDLFELMQLVPGFQSATDVGAVDAQTFRGPFRALWLIDGQEMVDMAYQTIPLVNRFPISNIDRVEIIRGPGSVLYGDTAQAAVIRVTTKQPTNKEHGLAAVNYGVTSEGFARGVGTLWASIGEGRRFLSVSGSNGKAIRGSGDYNDFFGGSFGMKDDAVAYPQIINVGAQLDDFSVRYIRDSYSWKNRDFFAQVLPNHIRSEQSQQRAELSYNPKIIDDLTGLFQINYAYDEPYNQTTNGARDLQVYFNPQLWRLTTTSELRYDFNESYSVLAGWKYFDQHGKLHLADDSNVLKLGTQNNALYAQLLGQMGFATMTAGTRYESNSQYDSEVVSRLALTKSEKDWHAKAQIAQAFRAPGYFNTVGQYEPGNPEYKVSPETSIVSELEVGHRLNDQIYFTANVFHSTTKDLIQYQFDPERGDTFHNAGTLGSQGFETNLRYHFSRGDVSLTYHYIRKRSDSPGYFALSPEGTDLDDTRFPGISPHSLVAHGLFKVTDDVGAFTSVQFLSSKYASSGFNPDTFAPVTGTISPIWLWNANLNFEKVGFENLDIQVGIQNILNDRGSYGRTLNELHAPVPRLGREGFVNAVYRW